MEKNIINIEKEILKGDILDLSLGDISLIYPYIKKDDELDLDYIENMYGKKLIQENSYDTALLFFTLQNIKSRRGKSDLLREISEYLKEKAYLHIWDINKKFGQMFKKQISIRVGQQEKDIEVKNTNLFTDNSMDTMIKLVQEHFTIVTFKREKDLYYIKCKKKKIRL
ncbi:hypothetical protein C3495_04440 [Clostridiaceae bacterium 14S0207]|nr:hypothetical protein C3495_04440 [Clostridiaceae bacterium 14S0207]